MCPNPHLVRAASALAIAALLVLVSGCGPADRLGAVETHRFFSEQLQQELPISVLLPPDYDPAIRYPVLYFFGDWGAGPVIVTEHVARDPACLAWAAAETEPLILVGVAHDQSFMLETDVPTEIVTTSSDMTFGVGRYASYFLEEIIPWVEGHYAARNDAAGRYIGGYSLGGYAALRLGLTHPELFSRVGAHSPTLFLESLPDEEVTAFMYPSEELRDQRDPLRLILAATEAPSNHYYVDTGLTDINREACELMAERLRARGISCELHLNPGTHSREYWLTHMAEYLAWYSA